MNTLFRAFRSPVPFVPQQGLTGLLEKRVGAASHLSLVQVATKIGAWDREADSDLYLDDAVSFHVNHGSDPGASALTLAQSAGFVWSKPRSGTATLNLTQFVHASLDGYYPSTSGDPDLSKHVMTASGDISVGQPVYVKSSNTVETANANPGSPIPNYLVTQAFGLCLVAGTDGNDVTILTEGSITSANWTAVTGTANLTAGALYFLDTTAGKLTYTAPSTDNCVVTRVGRALTTHIMDIEIGEVVYL